MLKINYNEVPTWTVNWTNKVFTTINPIYQINQVIVDWSYYSDLTFNNKTLTLVDAPTVNISIDYYRIDSQWATLQEIIEDVYFNLWESSNSTTYTLTRVKSKINQVIEDICKWEYNSLIDEQVVYKSNNLPFMNWFTPITLVLNTTLTADANVWDTVISCDTSNLPTSWTLYINWNIIEYTWTTWTTITWVSWILTKLLSWSIAKSLYKLPIDVEKSYRLFVMNSTSIWVWQFEVPYYDCRFSQLSMVWFTIRENWLYKYLDINYNPIVKDKLFWLYYTTVSVNLINDYDKCSIPYNYSLSIIPKIVAWELLWETEEVNQAVNILKEWYSKLYLMYKNYNSKDKKLRNKVEWKWCQWFTWYSNILPITYR